MGVERAQDTAFGAGRWFGVVYCVDEEGEAKDVGEEDEFLQRVRKTSIGKRVRNTYMSHITGYLPNFDKEIERGHPFVCT